MTQASFSRSISIVPIAVIAGIILWHFFITPKHNTNDPSSEAVIVNILRNHISDRKQKLPQAAQWCVYDENAFDRVCQELQNDDRISEADKQIFMYDKTCGFIEPSFQNDSIKSFIFCIASRRLSSVVFSRYSIIDIMRYRTLDESDLIGRFLSERIARDATADNASTIVEVAASAYSAGVGTPDVVYRFFSYMPSVFWKSITATDFLKQKKLFSTSFISILAYCKERRPSDGEMLEIASVLGADDYRCFVESGIIGSLYGASSVSSNDLDVNRMFLDLNSDSNETNKEIVLSLKRLCIQRHGPVIREAIAGGRFVPTSELRRILDE